MAYKFYCQLDYEHVPYISPTSPNGNLSNNGCGPISCSCWTGCGSGTSS